MQCDERNVKSVASAKGHGATYEGTLRSQFIYKTDGFRRNSAYFSWLDTEWANVRTALIKKLEEKERKHSQVVTADKA